MLLKFSPEQFLAGHLELAFSKVFTLSIPVVPNENVLGEPKNGTYKIFTIQNRKIRKPLTENSFSVNHPLIM